MATELEQKKEGEEVLLQLNHMEYNKVEVLLDLIQQAEDPIAFTSYLLCVVADLEGKAEPDLTASLDSQRITAEIA